MSKQQPAISWSFSRRLGLTLCRFLLSLRAVLLFSMLLLQASLVTTGILVMAHTPIPAVSRLIPILVLGHILSCCLVTMLLLTLVSTLQPVMSWWLALVLWQQILSIQLSVLLWALCILVLAVLYFSIRRRQGEPRTMLSA